MPKTSVRAWLVAPILLIAVGAPAAEPVRTTSGAIEGTTGSNPQIRIYRGIPYAAPPVGALRWGAPSPVVGWQGVRKAVEFGPRCLQGAVFADMIFRDQQSEDCLYLNVWTPARTSRDRLPVMVWIYGGGFQAGSASEPRQDGERLASKGVIIVSMNYRLGVFGFFAHPELTKESSYHASGNYGLLDQIAALQWVRRNIAQFGGDPTNVTIFGESAGSFAVSALMAAPLAQGLFHRAIGESGAMFTTGQGALAPVTLGASELAGGNFGQSIGAPSLEALRARPAEELLKATVGAGQPRFVPTLDGYVLPRDPRAVFADGQQSHVPLLAGWNADEVRVAVTLAKDRPTAASFTDQTRKRFGRSADAVLAAYPASNDTEAFESAASLASDLFIGHGTWRWLEAHLQTGRALVFRYSFDRKIPVAPGTTFNGVPATAADIGARHAGEIEYVFGTLDSVPRVIWQPEDRALSEQMMSYWTNFARNGNPNGAGLPAWPVYEKGAYRVIHLDTTVRSGPDSTRARYVALDAYGVTPGSN